jgi:WD repeat-containing protein 19
VGKPVRYVVTPAQELGNYKLAHSQLLETCRELTAQNKRVPAELSRQLLLLHSYVLVKTLVKFNDHAAAARMLVRACARQGAIERG